MTVRRDYYSFVPFIDAVDAFMIEIRKMKRVNNCRWWIIQLNFFRFFPILLHSFILFFCCCYPSYSHVPAEWMNWCSWLVCDEHCLFFPSLYRLITDDLSFDCWHYLHLHSICYKPFQIILRFFFHFVIIWVCISIWSFLNGMGGLVLSRVSDMMLCGICTWDVTDELEESVPAYGNERITGNSDSSCWGWDKEKERARERDKDREREKEKRNK